MGIWRDYDEKGKNTENRNAGINNSLDDICSFISWSLYKTSECPGCQSETEQIDSYYLSGKHNITEGIWKQKEGKMEYFKKISCLGLFFW